MQTTWNPRITLARMILASLTFLISGWNHPAALASETTDGSSLQTLNPLRAGGTNNRIVPGASQHFLKLHAQAIGVDRQRAIAAIYQLRECGPAGAAALTKLLAQPQQSMEHEFSILNSLAAMGPDAVPPLLEMLGSADDLSKTFAWQVLGRLGADAQPAIPGMIQTLRDDTALSDDRVCAANLLGEIGPASAGACDTLLQIAEQDENEPLKVACLEALRRLGPIDSAHQTRLVELLLKEDVSAALRVAAASVLVEQSAPPPVLLPALIGLAQDTDDTATCVAAVAALKRLGASAADAVPVLAKLVENNGTDVQLAAIDACAAMGPAATEAVPALINEIRNGNQNVPESAAAALVQIAPQAIGSLLDRLEDDDARRCTLRALAAIGPAARHTVPQLMKMLADPALSDLHVQVIEVLGSIGADASAAIPAMQTHLVSEAQPTDVRAASALALGNISPASAAVLLAALQDPDSTVRIAAAQALGQQNLRDRMAIPVLIRELADPVAAESAMQALIAIGIAAEPALHDLIFDEQADLAQRERGCAVLGRIGGNAGPILIKALQLNDEQLARAAELALYDLGPSNVIPLLVKAIDERERRAIANPPGVAIPDSNQPDTVVERMLELISDLSGGMGGPQSFGSSAGNRTLLEFRAMESSGSGGSAYRAEHEPMSAAPGSDPESAAVPMAGPPDFASDSSSESTAPSAGAPSAGAPIQPAAGVKAQGAMAPERRAEMKIVKVFYGTNRKPLATAGKQLQFIQRGFLPALIMGGATLLVCLIGVAQTRSRLAGVLAISGIVATVCLTYPAMQQASNSARSIALRSGPVYGNETHDQLQLGTCEVTIPADHKPGQMESPSILRLEFDQDPRKHIVLRDVTAYGRDLFHSELKRTLAEKGDSILVFVHGYNVDFDNAARRTAQLACDLEFDGAPLFFSWPSQGNWYEYRHDEKQVELAVPLLKQFLLDVASKSQAKSIHLIAHSMGNRALTTALKEMETASTAQATKFNQVVLAAPDIDADVFRSRIAPALLGHAQRVTLYASSNDLALTASRTFNSGDLRAGDTSRGLVVAPGIETIDVSAVDTSLLGHSYYGDSPTVLTDIKELLRTAHSADERPYLEPMAAEQMRYWVFQHPAIANQFAPDVTIR